MIIETLINADIKKQMNADLNIQINPIRRVNWASIETLDSGLGSTRLTTSRRNDPSATLGASKRESENSVLKQKRNMTYPSHKTYTTYLFKTGLIGLISLI